MVPAAGVRGVASGSFGFAQDDRECVVCWGLRLGWWLRATQADDEAVVRVSIECVGWSGKEQMQIPTG